MKHGVLIKKKDVIWNYIGTVMSMASGFVLLPFLLIFLSEDDLGLWYIFVAIGNFTLLFEFGFNPTFSRNIVYCLSGVKRIAKVNSGNAPSNLGEIDYHLLNVLLNTSKRVYSILALLVLVLVLTAGSSYVSYITKELAGEYYWVAWAIFCTAMVLNIYFYYCLTFLRGFGDVESENKAKTFAKIVQLVSTIILLSLGCGLIGAAVGYLLSGVALRGFAALFLRKHSSIWENVRKDHKGVSWGDVTKTLKDIGYIAWRDGLVQFACYGSTQATSIICSLFLTLGETGGYSVMLQIGTAVYHFSGAYIKSYYPMYQSAFVQGDIQTQKEIVKKGISIYFILFVMCAVVALGIVLPLIPLFRPGVILDPLEFAFLLVYLFLWNQHSIFCNLIVSTNRIPYVKAYLGSVVLGLILSVVFASALHWGTAGIIAGQFVSQAIYNNWKWPKYVLSELNLSYSRMMRDGISMWLRSFKEKSCR